MGLALYFSQPYITAMTGSMGFIQDAASLLLLMVLGTIIFFGVAFIIGALPKDMRRKT